MSKKGSKGKGRLNKGAVVDMMVDFFNRNDSRIVSPKEIFKELGYTSTSAQHIAKFKYDFSDKNRVLTLYTWRHV